MVLMFCPSCYCALHLYEISRKYLNDFKDTERTRVYGGNGHFQYSKGNYSKSRKISYGSCVLRVASWCLTFVPSFMKICQKV